MRRLGGGAGLIVARQPRIVWLLEQGSNLQALRHLINSQARLPISAIQEELVERAGLEPASPACKAGALPIELSSHGGPRGNRTRCLLGASEALCPMS